MSIIPRNTTKRNPNIQAIETRYADHFFRSRLESRWAVFFDACYLRWEYECEVFKDEEGNCYLPDFWLPDIETWVEIKPDWRPIGISWAEWWPLDWPVPLDLEPRLVVLFGAPADYNGYLSYDRDYRWQTCAVCGRVNLEYTRQGYRGLNHVDADEHYRLAEAEQWCPDIVPHAVQAAMSARFESGARR